MSVLTESFTSTRIDALPPRSHPKEVLPRSAVVNVGCAGCRRQIQVQFSGVDPTELRDAVEAVQVVADESSVPWATATNQHGVVLSSRRECPSEVQCSDRLGEVASTLQAEFGINLIV